jgi:hypothetical protein
MLDFSIRPVTQQDLPDVLKALDEITMLDNQPI